jgi:hypothetical protein
MANVNSLPSDRVAIAAVINPGALTTGAKNSGWVDLTLYTRLMAVITTGTLGASATLDAKWQQADDSSGTNATDVGTALTQILKASGDSKQAVMNFVPSVAYTSKPYARLVMTVGVATSDASAVVLGFDARHNPASANDLSTVVQVV